MDLENYSGAAYKGSRQFNQWDVRSADATGFNVTPDHFIDHSIDLNEQFVSNKPATFFMRVSSDAMADAGIHHGDVVIVDRSIKAVSGKIVIAILHGEMLIRRF